jgi:hypothetical protein
MVCSRRRGAVWGCLCGQVGQALAPRRTFIKAIERTLEEMRHLKTALGCAVAICLLGALAVPAFAHEFKASKYKTVISEATPVQTRLKQTEEEGVQAFTFGKFKLKCKKAHGASIITAPSSTSMKSHILYGECGLYPYPGSEIHLGASVYGGININFHVNGFAELEGNELGEELEYGTKAELLETSAVFKVPSGKICTVILPAQTVPAKAIKNPTEEFSSVSYSNLAVPVEETPTKLKVFPGGFQHKIIISMDLKALKYRFQEETQCGEDEAKLEHTGGVMTGKFVQEVIGGNLEFI